MGQGRKGEEGDKAGHRCHNSECRGRGVVLPSVCYESGQPESKSTSPITGRGSGTASKSPVCFILFLCLGKESGHILMTVDRWTEARAPVPLHGAGLPTLRNRHWTHNYPEEK